MIPSGVTNIKEWSFSGCVGLTSVTIPGSVKSIEEATFYICRGLMEVTIMAGVTSIGMFAFFGCSRLKTIVIPESITCIKGNAFSRCQNLKVVFFRGNAPRIEHPVFAETYNVICYYQQDTIGWDVFCKSDSPIELCPQDTSFDKVPKNDPSSVQTRGDYSYCVIKGKAIITNFFMSLQKDISIPSSLGGYPVTCIGKQAFIARSQLREVMIPDNVSSIGKEAFQGCVRLKRVAIASTVTTIEGYAFTDCVSLTRINIPSNVTSIGFGCFDGCYSLIEINVAKDNNSFSSVDGVFFDKTKTRLFKCPEAKEGSYTVPDSVIIIWNKAFWPCNHLTSVNINRRLIRIEGEDPFGECNSLTAINVDAGNEFYSSVDGVLFDKSQTTLIRYPKGKAGCFMMPKTVFHIGDCAFSGCVHLMSITISRFVYRIGNEIMNECLKLEAIIVDPENSNYCSIDGVMFNKEMTKLIKCPSSITPNYTVPHSVSCIEDQAFADCKNLLSITISSFAHFGEHVFLGCDRLTNINLPSDIPVSDRKQCVKKLNLHKNVNVAFL